MKVALVTGASRGLGVEMSIKLAAANWAVAVNCAHDVAGAGRTVAAIETAGGKAITARFDVTDEAAVRDGVAMVAAALGPIDLIVNNATGPQPVLPLADQQWADYQSQIDFFVKAPFLLLKEVLADWRRRRSGRIINIGSETFDTASAMFGHYVAAKGAMIGLTRSWAAELGPDGIAVNLVAPGWIPVERHAGADPKDLEAYLRTVPLGRMGLPEDVAGMVVFLASSGGDYITGQTFAVNGGRTFA